MHRDIIYTNWHILSYIIQQTPKVVLKITKIQTNLRRNNYDKSY